MGPLRVQTADETAHSRYSVAAENHTGVSVVVESGATATSNGRVYLLCDVAKNECQCNVASCVHCE